MIPKVIHYCWFGRGPMPELAQKCIESWHKFMPDWEYILWNEDNFDVSSYSYSREAYEVKKYAFVSDVARLRALKDVGGIYLDVDFEVYKPFDELLVNSAFAGFEGSKYNPVMMGVLGSEAGGEWVSLQLERYRERHFLLEGRADLTTNVKFVSDDMVRHGFLPNGQEQVFMDLHIYPVEYFCPKLTTGEYLRSDNTFCEQKSDESSWAPLKLKDRLFRLLPLQLRVFLIKTKRFLFEKKNDYLFPKTD